MLHFVRISAYSFSAIYFESLFAFPQHYGFTATVNGTPFNCILSFIHIEVTEPRCRPQPLDYSRNLS